MLGSNLAGALDMVKSAAEGWSFLTWSRVLQASQCAKDLSTAAAFERLGLSPFDDDTHN